MRRNVLCVSSLLVGLFMQLAFRATAYKISNAVNLLLFIAAIGLGFYSNTLAAALIVGAPAALVPFLLYRLSGDTLPARMAYGVAFMLFCALHIHQSLGFVEVHFGIFALLAFLIAFRDWRVVVGAAAVIAVHHLLFMYLQQSGVGVFVLPEEKLSLNIVLLHAFYVVLETFVLVVIARATLREAIVGQAFFDLTERLVAANGTIELHHRLPDIDNGLVRKFNGALDAIHDSVKFLGQSILDNRDAVAAMKTSTTQQAQGIAKQTKAASSIATATEQMSVSIKETQSNSEDIARNSVQTKSKVDEGQQAIAETQTSVTQLAGLLSNAKQAVNNMSAATGDIKSVLDVINGLADQTNLLALNAAIEAARAGESGRGFAVVADEVRQLASKTQQSTTQIEKTVGVLLQTSADSIRTVDLCLDQLTSTEAHSAQSRALLHDIDQQARILDSAIQEITAALDQQATASRDISASTQTLNTLASESSEVTELTRSAADKVADTTEQLAQELKRFHF